jgi:hypothetical protein
MDNACSATVTTGCLKQFKRKTADLRPLEAWRPVAISVSRLIEFIVAAF